MTLEGDFCTGIISHWLALPLPRWGNRDSDGDVCSNVSANPRRGVPCQGLREPWCSVCAESIYWLVMDSNCCLLGLISIAWAALLMPNNSNIEKPNVGLSFIEMSVLKRPFPDTNPIGLHQDNLIIFSFSPTILDLWRWHLPLGVDSFRTVVVLLR